MNHPVRSVLLAVALAASSWAAAQKIDNVPPAVQNNVPPNFMFMIDTSGSMKNIVVAAPYSASATYLASCSSSRRVDPSGGTVNLAVVSGGVYFRVGGSNTNLRHISIDSGNGRCFDNAAVYEAKLLANSGSGTRVPDNSYTDAVYSGHYLNWYFGNYAGATTGWADRKPGVETRMQVAITSSKLAVDSLPLPGTNGRTQVRVGLSTYRSASQNNDGGALRIGVTDYDASLQTQLKNAIDQMTPELYTPIASTLADIGRYMATGYNGNIEVQRASDTTPQNVAIDTLLKLDGTDNPQRNACLAGAPSCTSTSSPRPIQAWCQRSSIFAVTDGRPNRDRSFNNNAWIRDYDGDCSGSNASRCVSNGASGSWDRKNGYTYEDFGSDYMDDVAKLLFDIDLRPDLAKPTPAPNKPKAKNNITTYMIGFADAAVQSDPLLINTARQGGGRFIAATDGPSLKKAFDQVISDATTLDAAAAAVAVTNAQITNGTVGYASSYVSGSWYGDLEAYGLDITTGLQSGTRKWSARDQLNDQVAVSGHAARKIATWSGSAGIAFKAGNVAGVSDALVNYTRGDRTGEGTTFRQRVHLLGDIINAEPLVVNYSGGAVVFQAANDGMLHAFDGRVDVMEGGRQVGGRELWAYVPRLVHGKLAGRAAPTFFEHQYLVDGTPAIAEVTGVGSVARLLVGGLGKGGAGYYALDITSGTAADEAAAVAKVLWEFRPTNMGYSFGTPLIVRTAAGWRVVVASGLRNDTNVDGVGGDGRGRVWVLNPANGNVEKVFVTPAGFGTGTDSIGLAHLAKPQNLTGAAIVRHVYGGDLKGNVWRFDLDAASNSTAVQVAAVRDGNNVAQPISAPLVVSPVAASATKYFIYFGTGQYFSVDDVPGTSTPNATSSQRQTVYGIVDDTSIAAPTLPSIRGTNGNSCPTNGANAGGNGDLVCQSISGTTASHNPVDLTTRRGFYLDIPMAGGRVNTQAALTSGGTLVVVVNVPSNVTCEPGGTSFLLQLAGATGGAILKAYGGSDYFASVYSIGNALSSRPVIVITSTGPRALLRLSDKDTESAPIHETAGSAPGFRRIYMRPLN